jgi:hypothetical protein
MGLGTRTPSQTLTVSGNICLDDGAGCSARSIAAGAMEADASITGSAFDVAERFYAADDSIEAGDVVVLSGTKYEKQLAAPALDISEEQLQEMLDHAETDDVLQLAEDFEVFNRTKPRASAITGNVINENGLETDLSTILSGEPANEGTTAQSAEESSVESSSQDTAQNPSAKQIAQIKDELKHKIAENLKSKDIYIGSSGKDKLLAGKAATVSLTQKQNDPNIIGVVSSDPAFIMGSTADLTTGRSVPVALIGRVPVKVSMENGPIKVGDPLTSSSRKGYAAKAINSGRIIGYAIEDYEKEKPTDKILVFMQPGWYTAPGYVQQPIVQQQNDYISKINGSVVIKIG